MEQTENKSTKIVQIVDREVVFTLTDAELAHLGREAATYQRRIDEAEADLAEIRKEFKDRLKRLQSHRSGALLKIREGQEKRLVKCQKVLDYDTTTVTYVYEGQTIHERAMLPDELQRDLFAVPVSREDAVVGEQQRIVPPRLADEKHDVASVIHEETHRLTKHSAVDGPRGLDDEK